MAPFTKPSCKSADKVSDDMLTAYTENLHAL